MAERCSTCSLKSPFQTTCARYAWIFSNFYAENVFSLSQLVSSARRRDGFKKEKKMAKGNYQFPICWLQSQYYYDIFFVGYRNVKIPFKETAPLTHSLPDEMISPYSIIFISPLQCRNRWPACWLTHKSLLSFLITLSPFYLLENSLAYSLLIRRWKIPMQKCPVRPPALINANIIIYFVFFLLFFSFL